MRTWLTIAAVVLCSAARAADRPPPIPAGLQSDELFDKAQRVENGEVPGFMTRQQLSLLGRDDLIVDHVYGQKRRPTCEPLERNDKHVDPLSEVVARAASSGRLVIVNEGHDDAQTRAFILDLLAPLHDLGFSVYAAETFNRFVGRDAPRWPLLADGTYSYEPVFGEILRRARSLGFAFVPYEADEPRKAPPDDVAAQIAERETIQTQHIMDRIVTPLPQAKALIHVGYHHALEEPVGLKEQRWMANRLKAASGIDPLTVDQTAFQSPLDRPVVCALTSDADKKHALSTDLTIALPKPVIRRGRPDWRRARGQLDVDVPPSLVAKNAWSIVEARYENEPSEAVPADRILLAPGENLPLLLAPGRYRVEAWTRETGWSNAVEVAVQTGTR